MTDVERIAYDIVLLFAVAAWVLVASVLNFLIMGWDKMSAKRRGHRIAEAHLLGLAWLGGAPGMALSMKAFRHKTRHGAFRVTAWTAGVLWSLPVIAAAIFLIWEGTGH